MRLDQYLVKSGICSRSEAKKIIKKGRVCVNDEVAADSALHIDEKSDVIKFDNNRIEYEKFRYFMLNKPAGCVSATKDGLSQTVIDLLKGENTRDLFPVGRLDKDTEGLLLITNDGKLAHELLSPAHHVSKKYIAVASGKLSGEEMQSFSEGLDIGDDKMTMPAIISELDGKKCLAEELCDGWNVIGDAVDINNTYVYLVEIQEGRFHQIKRMFEAVGKQVVFLKRISMGTLTLDNNLKPGSYRRLSAEEVLKLKER